MKAVWMETWKGIKRRVYLRSPEGDDDILTGMPLGSFAEGHASDVERATLASAAPELVRALLWFEYADVIGFSAVDGDLYACRVCGGYERSPGVAMPFGHRTGCTVDGVLTKAGFPDRKSRDGARAEMLKK